jgi:hypothetical protein
MTKRIVCALLCVIFALILIGCSTPMKRVDDKQQKPPSMFVIVEGGKGLDAYCVVYHRDTKVMYAVSCGTYNTGNFTVLVNPDGSPMLWNGD